MGALRASIGVLLLSLALIACGGDDEGPAAIDLTKWLPPGALSYTSVDIAALREELGLPEDTDPFGADLVEFTQLTLGSATLVADPRFAEALDLGAVWAAASSRNGKTGVTVFSTEADTGEVGSTLGDLGFVDRGGVLGPTTGSGPAFRLKEGLIFVADDSALLREVASEPAEEIPSELMDELDAPVITTLTPPPCAREFALTSGADGSGVLAYLVDGGAEGERLDPVDDEGVTFGEPEVDGDLITLAVDSDGPGIASMDALSLFVTYDCG